MFCGQNGVPSSIKPQQITYIVPGVENFEHTDISNFILKAQDNLVGYLIEIVTIYKFSFLFPLMWCNMFKYSVFCMFWLDAGSDNTRVCLGWASWKKSVSYDRGISWGTVVSNIF